MSDLDIKVVRSISFPLSLYNMIDKVRGNVSRSKYVEKYFRLGLGMDAEAQGMKLETGDEHGQQSE